MIKRVQRSVVKMVINLAYGLVGGLLIRLTIGLGYTDAIMASGFILIASGGLKWMQQATAVPLTSFTMRQGRTRTFEDWMGHNTDLDENISPEGPDLTEGNGKDLFLNRNPFEWILPGAVLMTAGFVPYMSYF